MRGLRSDGSVTALTGVGALSDEGGMITMQVFRGENEV